MTVTQSRELRRVRKRRVLRLLAASSVGRGRRPQADDESLQEIRRAMQEWGAVTAPFWQS
jgi:hypothetical protein